MKLNVNKDLLVKHKFWIMLAVAVPAILAALFVLLVPVADAIANQRKKVHGEYEGSKKVTGMFVPTAEIEKVLAMVAESRKKEFDVWGRVYREQAEIFTWPNEFERTHPFKEGKFLRELKYLEPGASGPPDDEHHVTGTITDKQNLYVTVKTRAGKVEKFYRVNSQDMKLDDVFFNLQVGKDAAITFQTGRYFNDRLNDTEQTSFVNTYSSQVRPILEQVEPVNEDGEGVVQLRDWLVPRRGQELPHERAGKEVKFIRYVPDWISNVEISEDAWIAQEDLWIQREIYRIIRSANDYVAEMEPAAPKAKDKSGVFRNPYYELKLELTGASKVRATIRNLRNHRQKLEVNFRVRFNEDPKIAPEKLHLEGEPLDPPGTKDKKGNPTDVLVKDLDLGTGPPRTGVYSVSQILTWETAAVRRIDHIAIGSMALEDMGLNHRLFGDGTRTFLPEPKAEDAPPGQEGGEGPIRPQGIPGQANDLKLTVNRLIKNRYIDVTDQSRRVPVGVALIIDQDHLDRILTAFDNSKLRFLLNQVLVNRYPGTLRPNLPGREDRLAPGAPPGIRPPFRGGEGGEGGGQPSGAGAGQGGEEELEANLELVLYGTMTLYQRFPPRRLPAAGAEEAAKQ